MSAEYDVIVIGAGHNGLVAAALLAKAGQRVLVLESRELIGGAAATEEAFPGYRVDSGGSDCALFHQRIIETLSLPAHGLELLRGPAALFAPGAVGEALTLWHDRDRAVAEIGRRSPVDAERFPAFVEEVERMAAVLQGVALETPPDLMHRRRRDLIAWGRAAWGLKRLGRAEMMEFLRVLTMPVKDYLDERLDDGLLKGLLAATGVTGLALGPRAGGTTLMWLYQNGGGFMGRRQVRGGLGRLSDALAASARAQGAEIRTGAPVSRITMDYHDDYRATGVETTAGERMSAKTVVSNADPRRTLFDLVGPQYLDPSVMRAIRNMRFQGCVAKLDLALDGLPDFAGQVSTDQLSGCIRICPDMDYLERASDDAKYGHPAGAPLLDISLPTLLDPTLAPAGMHLMNITMQYAPYRLREGKWDDRKDELAASIIDTLARYAPDLPRQIRHQRILSPLELETRLGLTGGCIHHGRMGLDGMLIQRPIAGWSRYRTPIRGLYLCSAGTHPGGGVTGAPGYNAAREVLLDLADTATA